MLEVGDICYYKGYEFIIISKNLTIGDYGLEGTYTLKPNSDLAKSKYNDVIHIGIYDKELLSKEEEIMKKRFRKIQLNSIYGKSIFDESLKDNPIIRFIKAPKTNLEKVKERQHKVLFTTNEIFDPRFIELEKFKNYNEADVEMIQIILKWLGLGGADMNKIKSITINEEKKIVTVVFNDEDVQMVTCSENDEFDPYIGVALCIAQHQFKSKTQFHKFVNKNAKVIKAKEEKK